MSDSYSIVYSPEAMDDLREIYSYIAFYFWPEFGITNYSPLKGFPGVLTESG